MKKTALALLASLSLGVSLPASAQEYMFTYSKLYTQLKNNTKEGHDDVKVAVFFVDQQAQQTCHISKAWMEKEEHYEELKVSPANELLLPVDQNLRSANPLIFVQTQEQECAYSLVVMTQEPLVGNVEVAQLESLLPQMQAMLEPAGPYIGRRPARPHRISVPQGRSGLGNHAADSDHGP